MRPKSHYQVDVTHPRAKGVCDRCGQWWQLQELRWQFEWVGPRLQNLRILVCEPCYDRPQENIRTIVLPPDPIPVYNARPEQFVPDDNPMSAIGVDANFFTPKYGNRIGTLTGQAGINAPFDGNPAKPSWQSACNKTVSDSSYNNYVGINWQGAVANLSMPSSLYPPIIQHTLSQVTLRAPLDSAFLHNNPTNWVIQASPTDVPIFGAWTTIASGTTAGSQGEAITVTGFAPNPPSQFHRVAFQGDGVNYVSVAQVTFSVNEIGSAG